MDFGSERVSALLQQVGWTTERSVNTSKYRRCLEDKERTVFLVVLEFLQRFGNIKVVDTIPDTKLKGVVLDVDPIFASKRLGSMRFSELIAAFSHPLNWHGCKLLHGASEGSGRSSLCSL